MIGVQDILEFGYEHVEFLTWFVVVFFTSWVIHFVAVRIAKIASRRTDIEADDIIVDAVRRVRFPFYFALALYVAATQALTTQWFTFTAKIIFVSTGIYYGVQVLSTVTDVVVRTAQRRRGNTSDKSGVPKLLGRVVKAILWVIGALLLLVNVGVEITPLLAGVGVGGIAIAFALQSVLEDLFASFSIYFDKPFEEGDFIVIGDDSGTVKYIGLKSTRIDTLRGEELVVSNKELTSTRVQNFEKLQRRRVEFSFGVSYSTPADMLRTVKEEVRNVIEAAEKASVERVHFTAFGDSAYQFEAVYLVSIPSYKVYMDVQESINLEVIETLESLDVDMPFPTRTIRLREV